MIEIEKIHNSKHIVIELNNDSFAHADTLYSYLLLVHKKVSLVSCEAIDCKYSFLPWYKKVRVKAPQSADYTLKIEPDSLALMDFFKSNNITPTKKMATSLYAALLVEYDNFNTKECNGILFALASELIALGAEYQICREKINLQHSLASFRLRGLLFSTMQLIQNATVARLFISNEILDKTGASVDDVEKVMKDTLSIVNVESVELIENKKVIKTLKDI